MLRRADDLRKISDENRQKLFSEAKEEIFNEINKAAHSGRRKYTFSLYRTYGSCDLKFNKDEINVVTKELSYYGYCITKDSELIEVSW